MDLGKKISKLDKVAKFLKKLKKAEINDRESILKEFDTFNLNKYVSEIAISISEYQVLIKDLEFYLELCTKFNATYEEFSN